MSNEFPKYFVGLRIKLTWSLQNISMVTNFTTENNLCSKNKLFVGTNQGNAHNSCFHLPFFIFQVTV